MRKSARDVLSQLDWSIPGTMVAVISHGFKIKVERRTGRTSRPRPRAAERRQVRRRRSGREPLAIDEAVRMFTKVRNDPKTGKPLSAIEIVILYGDGCDPSVPSCPGAANRASGAASGQGSRWRRSATKSGRGRTARTTGRSRTRGPLAFKAPAGRLPSTVRDLQEEGRGVTVASVSLKDILPPVLRLVPGSANPPPAVAGSSWTSAGRTSRPAPS
ncbi:MAG: hypothetical protein U0470_09490 [Anaerolineae bacterium]